MIIQSIHTGGALDGGRRAILTVAPEQKPGSLAGLREHLEAHGLKASPGYEDGHLLRVRGFDNDAELRDLLQDYAGMQGQGDAKEPLLDSDLAFIPLDAHEKQPQPFRTFIRRNATGLVGLLSLVSGFSFMKQAHGAWKDSLKDHPPAAGASCDAADNPVSVGTIKAGINLAAAGMFITASSALALLGFEAARKPSVPELIKSLEPRLKEAMDQAAPDLSDHRSALRRAVDGAKNKPWLVATVFNALGTTIKTVGHALPHQSEYIHPFTQKAVKRCEPDRLELAASGSSFVSLGFLATATPKPSLGLLGMPSFEKSDANDPLKQRYTSRFMALSPRQSEQGGKNANMKIGGLLAMASTTFFGLKGALDVYAGYRQRHTETGRKQMSNWVLLPVVLFNLTADYLTTIAKPRFVYSTDELATETAAYIAAKLDRDTVNPERLTKEVYLLSELLARHPRVEGNSHQLREAVAGRLHMDHGYDMLSNQEGLPEYRHLWEISPFTRPQQKAPETVAEPAQTILKSAFVDKLQMERELPSVRGIL